MHEYGTTSEQLAWVKVAASHHAQYNEHAMLRDVVTVEDVVNSPKDPEIAILVAFRPVTGEIQVGPIPPFREIRV